ncbi:MAG: PTS glucose transporter subunit IIA [Acetatifactor sp.]|nr:PTS glucose transporter subunit IIA [Acetatifactor sp.]
MGITLNVWIFSGIIGVAYIMGYLMSRTMGRVLAVEGADPEEMPRETVWSEKVSRRERQRQSGRTTRQEATMVSERTAWPETTAWDEAADSDEIISQENQIQAEKANRRKNHTQADGANRRENQVQAGRAYRENQTQSGRAYRQENQIQCGRAYRQETQGQSGRAYRQESQTQSGRAYRQEGQTQAERASRQDNRSWFKETYQAERSVQEPDRDNYGGETREWQKARVQRRYRSRSHREQQAKPAGHPIASPVAGQVDVLEGQGRRGVLLTPEDNRVYAPASGKIIRLYPRGNEFLLRTDSGVVLRLQAGERDADMTRDYFRPRIMQNEFVGKGKLLLEYDREALARDGYDTHVSMTVEEEERSYDLSVTGSMWVKNGHDCLWVL